MHAQLHAHDTDAPDSSSFHAEKNALCATLFNEREERLDGMFSPDFHLLVGGQVVVECGGDDGGGAGRGGHSGDEGGGGGNHPSFMLLFYCFPF